MKYLLCLFFLITTPVFSKEGKNPNLIQLENNMTLDCEEYGDDSCSARFLTMAGCAYVMGINSGKSTGESMEIGSDLFVSMMKGHNLKASNMFDNQNNLKESIRTKQFKDFVFVRKKLLDQLKFYMRKRMEKFLIMN